MEQTAMIYFIAVLAALVFWLISEKHRLHKRFLKEIIDVRKSLLEVQDAVLALQQTALETHQFNQFIKNIMNVPIKRNGVQFISYVDDQGNLVDENGKPHKMN